ncbi:MULTISPECIES: hypothetical protein [Roseobacteraceae]|uniref:Tat pathway signal sequence domain protein n=1 Tax=Pseudosulfitobacter pseudonitzschiae TaxID=1402135 RepID=A0A221JYL4_9RHOB|nr:MULTISPECIES: hypothetical protein [Roseobacteraceae]ASM71743.1 hypothetical protein SULPSESMR1_00915 [Pseudosulfitobacter pseudonitzschiae]
MQPYRHIGACLATAAAVLFGTAAQAQEATPPAGVALELNAADLVGEACRITFVATNTGTAPIDRAVYETVLFGADGGVMMLTLFDFGSLPAGVPRVRQFQIADTACGRIGSLLINGAGTCTVEGADSDVCAKGLATSSRLNIGLQG